MTLKKMVSTYIDFQCDNEVWKMFSMMGICGLLADGLWDKFFDQCKGYYFDEEDYAVHDADGKVLKQFDFAM